ncbi:NADP-dependent oxidoreductase [Diaphorobacter aerolatus]|uniref:NADP-dependent oxidoreductase n=1 Tax=Diaphorobacter aerolatus TaxID=1288495 RepID=A0A7H0GLR0_9BURK|nr:NADP-dependent oxidoreductase [Diaphorobacter aerolatus]QNP49226.1 NADP-dependent oxidoreductase [Diaphorobacter aerolatus]
MQIIDGCSSMFVHLLMGDAMQSTVMIAKTYGQADVLEFLSVELPPLAVGMARIQVRAAGINPIDARRMTGEFRHAALPQTFGTEFAGEILEINMPENAKWSVGDAVLGSGGAFTHASVIDVPVGNLVAKPPAMSWEVAGSLAGVAQTAMTILNEVGKVRSLLVHGASGGVGSITVQLARERGMTVVATASASNQDYLRSLGAVPVVYGAGLTERLKAAHPQPFDASIDMSGTEEATQASLATVVSGGFMGSIAGRKLSSPLIKAVWVQRNPANLQHVADGVAAGRFSWTVSKTYPFAQARAAYLAILEGHSRGKTALMF